MVGQLVVLGGLALVLAGLVAVVFVLGMRRKWPLVTGAVIGATRRWMNPGQLRTAGGPGAAAAVIHHRGRTSGRDRATPVDIEPWEDGFVVALPYGTRTQWARNVLAAGSARVTLDGRTWAVDRPELVPTASVIDAFGPADRRLFRLFRTDRCLQLHRVAVIPRGAPPEGA